MSRLLLFLFASGFFFLFNSSVSGFELKEEKRVLVLFSNQSDLPVYPLIEKGIKSSLDAGSEFRIEYYIEYMDRFRNTDPTHYRRLLDLYRHKYAGRKIDLIISWSGPASQWVSDHRDEIFAQTPVVFAGICRPTSSKASCSATSAALSRGPIPGKRVGLKSPTAPVFF